MSPLFPPAPVVALAFFDEQNIYFAEIDVNKPTTASPMSPAWDSSSLTHFVLERFGDANWEPRFAARNLKREKDGWTIEVGINGEVLSLKRLGNRQWVELPRAKDSNPANDTSEPDGPTSPPHAALPAK